MHLSMNPIDDNFDIISRYQSIIRNIKLRYRYLLKVLPKFAQCQEKNIYVVETYYPCRLLKD